MYFGSLDGSAYALSASTGKQLWKYPIGGSVEEISVDHGLAFVTSSTGGIYAVDAKTGKERWRYQIGSGGAQLGAHVEAQGLVIVGSNSGDALRAEGVDWKARLEVSARGLRMDSCRFSRSRLRRIGQSRVRRGQRGQRQAALEDDDAHDCHR